jgi:hypothetical protein
LAGTAYKDTGHSHITCVYCIGFEIKYESKFIVFDSINNSYLLLKDEK